MSLSMSKSSISVSIPISKPCRSSFPNSQLKIQFESLDSKSKIDVKTFSSTEKLLELETDSGLYPGGMPKMGPFTRRDPNVKKLDWLRQRAPQRERFKEVKDSLSRFNLNTVCKEAQCPNIGECWNGGGDGIATATSMVLGDTCTRGCRFCVVKTSRNPVAPNPMEPENIA